MGESDVVEGCRYVLMVGQRMMRERLMGVAFNTLVVSLCDTCVF